VTNLESTVPPATLLLAQARPRLVRGERESGLKENYAVLMGLLAVAQDDADDLPSRASAFVRSSFVAAVEERVDKGVVRRRSRKDANEWVSETLRDIRDKFEVDVGGGDELLIRNPAYFELNAGLVRVDIVDAADELRAIKHALESNRPGTAGHPSLEERLEAAHRTLHDAYLTHGEILMWLDHAEPAIRTALKEVERLRVLVHDPGFPESRHVAAVAEAAASLRKLGEPLEAVLAEIKAATDHFQLDQALTAAKEYLQDTHEVDQRKFRTEKERVQHASERQRWRLTPRWAPHEIEGAAHWAGRHELVDELHAFWEAPRGGVLAVIGLGGAGKTALVRHFVDQNGWLQPPYSADAPDAIFIWSCYHAEFPDSVEHLVEAASRQFLRFLSRAEAAALPNAPDTDISRLVEILRRAKGRFLFILDGLERLQVERSELEGGAGAAFARGEFLDPALGRLMRFVGRDTGVKVIATSRVSLTTLSSSDVPYRELDITRMDPASADALLQGRGVGGSREARIELADALDFHALTLSVVGSWLAAQHHGNPAAIATLPDVRSVPGEDAFARAVRKLHNVLTTVEAELGDTETLVLNTIGAVRIPVPIELLKRVVLRRARQSGGSMPSDDDLRAGISSLTRRGLMFILADHEGKEVASSHVLVRTFYYDKLDADEKRHLHQCVDNELVEVIEYLPEGTQRDQLIHERVHQLRELKQWRDAYAVYDRDLGGYTGLGWGEGKHAAGARLMQLFMSADVEDPDIRYRATTAGVLHLKNIGLLDQAAAQLERLELESKPREASDAAQNLAGIYLMRGHLGPALGAATRATQHAATAGDDDSIREANARLVDVAVRSGDVTTAKSADAEARDRLEKGAHFVQLPGLGIAWLYIWQNRLDAAGEALVFADDALTARERGAGTPLGMLRARYEAARGALALSRGDLDAARDSRDHLMGWGLTKGGDEEMVVVAHLAGGRIARAEGDLEPAEVHFRFAFDVASERGLGLHWIDACVDQAYLQIAAGRTQDALANADLALQGKPETELEPGIVGAGTDPPAYRWGALFAHRARHDALVSAGRVDEAAGVASHVGELETELGCSDEPSGRAITR
jgi:tetratricopeptide (TPR) repeat protein